MHADMAGYYFSALYLFDAAETGLLTAGIAHTFYLGKHPHNHNLATVAHPTALTVKESR